MNKVKNILILVIIFNLILMIYLIFYTDKIDTITLDEYKLQQGYYNNYKFTTVIYFDNYSELKNNYNGQINLSYLLDEYTNLIQKNFNFIYQETKNLNNTELKKYFTENIDKIGIIIGIEKFEDFQNLIDNLQIFNYKNLEYESSKLVKDSLIIDDKFTSFDLEIYYNRGKLEFKVYISNYDNIKEAIIKFLPKGENS